ncbi:hypothetical protein HL658_17570 [Azospirillum sp. RWY-5-1]|uniref:LysR substrate-binding domain-containing protein n=1 Tax=Azospirillum oleiclasticum TaxID=2735135 RepID=A0ABX2TJM5_9PROT|nr:LysR substrate-binding domain-containing protein [Azospirillum oleiclasticum]NYZ14364.1 hypothetical protein [Azospirillum oleiclasticum]NYZ23284.1 hypothetical protein [Azospirillum oleiclasticum]
MPRLDAFRSLHPAIEITLRPTDGQPDLLAFEADAAIGYDSLKRVGVQQAMLANPRVFPVAKPADLIAAPLIHEESHDQWLASFATAGVDAPARLGGPRLWHAHLAIEAAKLGQGVALANDLIAGRDLATGELVEIGTSSVALSPYVFSAKRGRWKEPAVERAKRPG